MEIFTLQQVTLTLVLKIKLIGGELETTMWYWLSLFPFHTVILLFADTVTFAIEQGWLARRWKESWERGRVTFFHAYCHSALVML